MIEFNLRILPHFLALSFLLCSSYVVSAEDANSFIARHRAEENQHHITRSDLSFFFERISLTNQGWEFKLSPNVRGMLWRIRKDNSDVTGACDSGQIIDLKPGASLLIERKDLDLFFDPRGFAGFTVRLRIKPDGGSDFTEAREAIMAARGEGFVLMFAED